MFSSAQIHEQGNNVYVTHGDDKGLRPVFSLESVLDEEKTKAEGRPIYKDVETLTIYIIGDPTQVTVRPVIYEDTPTQPSDINRFPNAWAAFKNQNKQVTEGTPLTEWPPVSRSLAMELKALNIHTVEDLATVSDANLKWLGARQLRDKAIGWLEQAKSGAPSIKQAEEIESLKRQITALTNQLQNLSASKKKKGED